MTSQGVSLAPKGVRIVGTPATIKAIKSGKNTIMVVTKAA